MMTIDETDDRSARPRVLLTGATGYVGGRLLPALLERDLRVRCLARRPEQLRSRIDHPDVEVVGGDVLDRASLDRALADVDVAFYLVHSMGARAGSFEEQDRVGARNFGRAARAAGVRRIVYLGGLGDPGLTTRELSPHLRSRQEVGDLLRQGRNEVVELRASIVIGAGSLSFEMVRALTERLPVMITPRWVDTLAQPIAIEDLIDYLVAARDAPTDGSQVVEIGGPDQVGYGELMREYARQRGLRRRMLRVPLLTPRLSSLWLGLVTPLYARVGRKLIDSLRNATLVTDDSATRVFPAIRPRGVAEAIARAMAQEDQVAATRWSDALSASTRPRSWGGVRFGARLVDSRESVVDAPAAAAFAPIRRIGGERGWYFANWLWRLRGLLDLLIGGVGMRRGRRDPETLRPGDVVDFWRVEDYEPGRRLRLVAEMKVPGRAWLELEVSPVDERRSTIRQTAVFDPVGLAGLAYWYGIYPVHLIVFRGMLAGLARAARAERDGSSDSSRRRTRAAQRAA